MYTLEPSSNHSRRSAKACAAVALCAMLLGGACLHAQSDPSTGMPPQSYRSFPLNSVSDFHQANEIQTAVRNLVPHARVYYVPSQGALDVVATAEEMGQVEKILADLDHPQPVYRLTYTITRTGDASRTEHETVVVAEQERTELKRGLRVPLVTGDSGGHSNSTQVQYIDLGLLLTASIDGNGAGRRLHTKIEQSSIATEKPASGLPDPEIRQVSLDERSTLTTGKTIQLGSLDLPDSAGHLEISVMAEVMPQS